MGNAPASRRPAAAWRAEGDVGAGPVVIPERGASLPPYLRGGEEVLASREKLPSPEDVETHGGPPRKAWRGGVAYTFLRQRPVRFWFPASFSP